MHQEMQPFFLAIIFFGAFFGQVKGNLGENLSHPQKFACSHTYGEGSSFLGKMIS